MQATRSYEHDSMTAKTISKLVRTHVKLECVRTYPGTIIQVPFIPFWKKWPLESHQIGEWDVIGNKRFPKHVAG